MACIAVIHEGVCKGTCVMILGKQIVYAGPIKYSPVLEDACVLLNPVDHAHFCNWLDNDKGIPKCELH